MAYNYDIEIDGAASFARKALAQGGLSVVWIGATRAADADDGEGGYQVRPAVYARGGQAFPGYLSGREWVVFDRCPVDPAFAPQEAEAACRTCCG